MEFISKEQVVSFKIKLSLKEVCDLYDCLDKADYAIYKNTSDDVQIKANNLKLALSEIYAKRI